MKEQPRDEIGRFGDKPQSAPEVSLPHAQSQGSFLYPPATWPGGATQYIEFWENAPISDETLSNIGSAYAANRDEWEKGELETFANQWGNGPEARKLTARKGTTPAVMAAAYGEARSAFLKELEAERPRRLPMARMRTIAKAAGMHLNAGQLHEDEREKVYDAPSHWENNKPGASVRRVWDNFHLEEIMPDALMGSYGVERKLDVLREEIAQLRNGG